LDRLRLRYVIDFIEMHWRHRLYWPTFNVADMASAWRRAAPLEMLLGLVAGVAI